VEPGILHRPVDRRGFLSLAGRGAVSLGAAGALPALLAACGRDEPAVVAPASPGPASKGETVLVGDVLDYALRSEDWEGAFGFVRFRVHPGMVDGRDVYFIRTDVSDQVFADSEKLVWAPKLAGLARRGLTGEAFLASEGTAEQTAVLSSEPGRRGYTPAWRINRVTWDSTPRTLRSVADVRAAEDDGDLRVERTDIVVNGAVVKWSKGEMPVDDERREYLGPGQLLEPVDTSELTVTFKLHECFPGVRYIVCDTSLKPMAEGMAVVHSPGLEPSPTAGATGRTNVFMNGIEGPGPMGFQPSVFDSQAGSVDWSPYWDHMTYAWRDGVDPRVLTTEGEVHAVRDDGGLEEFPGTPDTGGEIFTVNCPVPIVAPNTFTG
jgi:hypothetical protein